MNKELNPPSPDAIEYSTFFVEKTLCGIDILKIQEINRQFDITKVPQSAGYIQGILNLRGKIITVIDLGKRLGLAPVDKTPDSRNIIVDSKDEHIGLVVDRIDAVIKAVSSDIETSPANLNGVSGRYFKGVLKTTEKLIGIIDIDKVLNTA